MRRLGASVLAMIYFGFSGAALAQGTPSPEELAALAALEAELPGTLMNNPIAPGWNTYGGEHATKVIRVPEVPGEYAYEVRIKQPNRNPWDVSVTAPLNAGVTKGDAVLVAFWARAEKPSEATGAADVQVRVQEIGAPYTGVAEAAMSINTNWQLHYVKGIAPADYKQGDINIAFNVGKYKQTIQFGQVYVMNLGPGVRLEDLPSASEGL